MAERTIRKNDTRIDPRFEARLRAAAALDGMLSRNCAGIAVLRAQAHPLHGTG